MHIGTSGWTYDDWQGAFYPDGVKGPERLSFYATQFDTVEINASFYRFPTQNMIDAWNRRLERGFHLVVKGHRRITHLSKLVDCGETLEGFLERVHALRRLRVILWQLPPSLRMDTERLGAFLDDLERQSRRAGLTRQRLRHAVEFRHESWWAEDVARLLARCGVSFVAVSHPRLPAEILPTADFVYLRFHGLGRQLYDYDYSDDELRQWVDRLRPHLDKRTLYAFFNNDWHANAPRNAISFRNLLGSC